MYITAQIVGIIALICAVISFQQRTHKRILAFQLAANTVFCIHFIMLGAYTGALLNAVAALRSLVFVNKGKPFADNVVWLYVFCIVSVVAGVFTWNGFASILPIAGMVCTTVAFWIKKPSLVRLTAFPSSPMWLAYNLITGSYAGVITEIVNMCSIITAIIRIDIKKKNE